MESCPGDQVEVHTLRGWKDGTVVATQSTSSWGTQWLSVEIFIDGFTNTFHLSSYMFGTDFRNSDLKNKIQKKESALSISNNLWMRQKYMMLQSILLLIPSNIVAEITYFCYLPPNLPVVLIENAK